MKKNPGILFLLLFSGIYTSQFATAKPKGFVFEGIMLNLNVSGSMTIAIATHDQRPTIKEGKRSPDFVGYLRNGYGMAYPTGTSTKNPMAEEMTKVIASSFNAKGFKATPVNVLHTETGQDVLKKLTETGSTRFITLTLNQWHGDQYSRTCKVIYDISVKVYDQNGNLLAEQTRKDDRRLLGDSKKPWDYLKIEVPKFFKHIMEEMLNDPEVVKLFQ